MEPAGVWGEGFSPRRSVGSVAGAAPRRSGGDELVEQLVAEHRRPLTGGEPVDAPDDFAHAAETRAAGGAAAFGDFDGEARDAPGGDAVAGVGGEPTEAPVREEADVTPIENAATVVVEAPGGDPQAWVPVGEVRDADEHRAPGRQPATDLGEDALRGDRVLQHVGEHDDVEVAARFGRDAAVEIGLEELVDAAA